MHSWHCALFAMTTPSCEGAENCESAMPATYPVGRSRDPSSLVECAAPAFPPRAAKNCSVNLSRLAPRRRTLEAKADRVDQLVARGAAWIGSVLRHPVAMVCGFASVTGGRLVFTPAGGSGTC